MIGSAPGGDLLAPSEALISSGGPDRTSVRHRPLPLRRHLYAFDDARANSIKTDPAFADIYTAGFAAYTAALDD